MKIYLCKIDNFKFINKKKIIYKYTIMLDTEKLNLQTKNIYDMENLNFHEERNNYFNENHLYSISNNQDEKIYTSGRRILGAPASLSRSSYMNFSPKDNKNLLYSYIGMKNNTDNNIQLETVVFPLEFTKYNPKKYTDKKILLSYNTNFYNKEDIANKFINSRNTFALDQISSTNLYHNYESLRNKN